MVPEIILLTVFTITLLVLKITRGKYELAMAGRIAMSAMLLVTSIAHFVFTKGMSMMLPDFIPLKVPLVYLTGFMELSISVGLQLTRYRVFCGWLLIAFLISLLPANIYAATTHVNIQKGTYDGEGLNYLWFRIPLQVFFITWVYLSSVRNNNRKEINRSGITNKLLVINNQQAVD